LPLFMRSLRLTGEESIMNLMVRHAAQVPWGWESDRPASVSSRLPWCSPTRPTKQPLLSAQPRGS